MKRAAGFALAFALVFALGLGVEVREGGWLSGAKLGLVLILVVDMVGEDVL